MNQKDYIDGDIIDLRELIHTIGKSKKLIIFVTAIITLLAIVYAYILAKPIYEVKAMVEIGKINAGTKEEMPLDDLQDVKQKLSYLYGVSSKKKKAFPRVKTISVPKKSNSFIYITVESKDNASAINYINTVTQKLEQDYTKKINAHINTQKELLKLTQKDISVTQKSLSDAELLLKDYAQKILDITQKDAALAGLYSMQINDIKSRIHELQSYISELKEKEYNIQLSLSPLKLKSTSVIGEIEVSDNPVKPQKALIVIVAFIIGLIFSLFLVFLLSFIRSQKEES
ncbi:hypothetical protein C9926_03160 [Sulfurovum lithotrophicum]|nr:hypothetical protein C9926_03160 [Sulfurovum lithotrophicum]